VHPRKAVEDVRKWAFTKTNGRGQARAVGVQSRPVAGAKGRDKYLDEFFRLERRQGSSGGDCGHHSRWFFSLHAPNLKKMKYDAMRPLHVQIE